MVSRGNVRVAEGRCFSFEVVCLIGCELRVVLDGEVVVLLEVRRVDARLELELPRRHVGAEREVVPGEVGARDRGRGGLLGASDGDCDGNSDADGVVLPDKLTVLHTEGEGDTEMVLVGRSDGRTVMYALTVTFVDAVYEACTVATVAEGEPVAIMEAMKMETRIRAPRAGHIRIAQQPTAAVAAGAELALID